MYNKDTMQIILTSTMIIIVIPPGQYERYFITVVPQSFCFLTVNP